MDEEPGTGDMTPVVTDAKCMRYYFARGPYTRMRVTRQRRWSVCLSVGWSICRSVGWLVGRTYTECHTWRIYQLILYPLTGISIPLLFIFHAFRSDNIDVSRIYECSAIAMYTIPSVVIYAFNPSISPIPFLGHPVSSLQFASGNISDLEIRNNSQSRSCLAFQKWRYYTKRCTTVSLITPILAYTDSFVPSCLSAGMTLARQYSLSMLRHRETRILNVWINASTIDIDGSL